MTLAVLDWGIGGVPTWNAIRRRAPKLDVIYMSDSGYAPYGTVPKAELRARLSQVCAQLRALGATRIAVACNAASSAVDEANGGSDVYGILEDGVRLALGSGATSVAVLGGEGTIREGVHAARLRGAGRRVFEVPAQSLSAHVEAGRLSGRDVEADVESAVRRSEDADVLLLACTHYPALGAAFRKFTSRPLLDPCVSFAERVLGGLKQSGSGECRFFTSGDAEAARRSAALAFGVDLGNFEGFPA